MRKNAIHDTTETIFRGRVGSMTAHKSRFRTAEKLLLGHGKAFSGMRNGLSGDVEKDVMTCCFV